MYRVPHALENWSLYKNILQLLELNHLAAQFGWLISYIRSFGLVPQLLQQLRCTSMIIKAT